MKSNTIRVVAAVVDTAQLTLYKENGETLVLPQGDPRIRKIVDEVAPGLLKDGYADVDLSQENTYSEFENQTSGGIKLFRVAKAKLKSMFGFGKQEKAQVDDLSIGVIPNQLKQTQAAVAEILEHAVPVTSGEFHETTVAQQGNIVEENGKTPKVESEITAPETIVAVVEGKIIPGMEKIKSQFSRAVSNGSTIGMENFLKRLSTVIEQRSHSVEDLLKFLERGDLPIADDGSILIYKVLNRKGDRTNGKYVDCHTRKVEQWTGAYVCMDPSLVDPNRRNECSNGLHVARRGYVGEFNGDVCVLAKLAPEDVIAVPSYDANKMRVCGYHILMELTPAQFTLLKRNRPLTEDEEGKKLLANALRGQHIHKTHEVRITGQMGEGVQVKALGKQVPAPKVEIQQVEAVALANPAAEALDQPVDPKEVVTKVEQMSRKEQAQKLYADGDVTALKALKKAAKVSWDKLGVPDPDIKPPVKKAKVTGKNPSKVITDELISAAAEAVEQFGEDELERYRDEQEAKPKVSELVQVTHGEGSPRERIQKLLAIGLTSVGVAQAILDLKKKAKKSWDTLGVTPDQVDQIAKLVK
jgi:hypothetical protein